jgi:hypothetical protein
MPNRGFGGDGFYWGRVLLGTGAKYASGYGRDSGSARRHIAICRRTLPLRRLSLARWRILWQDAHRLKLRRTPMRWVFLLVAMFGFALVFSAKTPGALGLGLLIGLVGLFGALFAFAAARIASSAQPDAALLTDKDINALRASMRKTAAPAPSNVSSASVPNS